MVAWAQRYGLRLSEAGCCPRWLLRDGSQSCHPRYRVGDPCTRYGTPRLDSGWLDHRRVVQEGPCRDRGEPASG
ncbi:hypothetical protein [Streptomyces sp. WAC 06725]|uniref:hypothetical protein n=1 Tax=Streptomyces sp. WAC 06725 TaxID=2203209 RepID=UPI000F737B66|nr:hypothetical protein [Streptomyces sp. WAC 06725]